MNPVDIILLVCFIPFIISGVRSGFIRQFIGLVALVTGIWASWKFASILSGWIGTWLEASGPVINISSFVLIFIAVSLVLGLLARLLEGIISIAMLGWLNKCLGILFSVLKCGLAIGLGIILFDALNGRFHLVQQSVLNSSALYYPINEMAQSVFPYIKNFLFG